MTEISQDVLEKIRKVKALAYSGTAGEMENAAAMLSRLLVKYNLTIESLDNLERGDVGYSFYENGAQPFTWRAELMYQIAKHHFCQVIAYDSPNSSLQKIWVIVGRPHNQDAVKDMYEYLEGEVTRLGAQELIKAKVEPPGIDELPEPDNLKDYLQIMEWADSTFESWKMANNEPGKWADSWRVGAVRGITDRFEKERRDMKREASEGTWAIVPLLDKEVQDYIDENLTVVEKKRTIGEANVVYQKGREVGRGIGIEKLAQ
jgi:hypothetical protein